LLFVGFETQSKEPKDRVAIVAQIQTLVRKKDRNGKGGKQHRHQSRMNLRKKKMPRVVFFFLFLFLFVALIFDVLKTHLLEKEKRPHTIGSCSPKERSKATNPLCDPRAPSFHIRTARHNGTPPRIPNPYHHPYFLTPSPPPSFLF
jgi:hypothetical protein